MKKIKYFVLFLVLIFISGCISNNAKVKKNRVKPSINLLNLIREFKITSKQVAGIYIEMSADKKGVEYVFCEGIVFKNKRFLIFLNSEPKTTLYFLGSLTNEEFENLKLSKDGTIHSFDSHFDYGKKIYCIDKNFYIWDSAVRWGACNRLYDVISRSDTFELKPKDVPIIKTFLKAALEYKH